MDKYIMPKLTGFDGKRYLNIDFSDSKYKNVCAVRIDDYLFIKMTVVFSGVTEFPISNFLRDIKIKRNTNLHFGFGIKHTATSGAVQGTVSALYNARTNDFNIRATAAAETSDATVIIILPIEEGF